MKRIFFVAIIFVVALILRLHNLADNPPSLYWDEASIAYNAYAIVTEGIDEHGVSFPLTHFLAYGDAKPPLYIYAVALSYLVFDVGEFAVRFPSALAGSVSVLLSFFLVKKLFEQENSKTATQVALLTSLLLAINPWHIHISRVGYEANLALCFFLIGLTSFFYRDTKKWLLVISAISFVATWYTFNAYRIFLPPLLIVLGVLNFRSLLKDWKWGVPSALIALVLTAPLIPFVLSDQARLRFNEVTIFKDHAPIWEANERNELNQNALWSRVIHNRRVLFGLHFLRHYSDNLKPDFWFFSGDVNPRLGYRDGGLLYIIELPLLLLGIFWAARSKTKISLLFLFWALFSFIPAGVARETPHALRILQILPLPLILVAWALSKLAHKKVLIIPLVGGYVLSFLFFWHTYQTHYPNHWSNSWQSGYKEMVTYVSAISQNYDRVYITNSLGRPHTYLLFYTKQNPREYVSDRDAGGDAFGFTEVYRYQNYYFGDPPEKENQEEFWLVVSPANPDTENISGLRTIANQKGDPVFIIHEM